MTATSSPAEPPESTAVQARPFWCEWCGAPLTRETEDAHTCDEDEACEHPVAAVLSDVNGDHLCTLCDAEWWEDPL